MSTLHTIGYEGSNISDFLATLNAVNIDLLIDVRDVPVSRKKGFSKHKLAEQLAVIGIDYLHLKALGDPKDGRLAAREGRYDDFRRVFGEHMLTEAAREHLSLALEASRGRVACLLCFERDHKYCHRCIVANEMARLGGFKLRHLGVRAAPSNMFTLGDERGPNGALAIVG